MFLSFVTINADVLGGSIVSGGEVQFLEVSELARARVVRFRGLDRAREIAEVLRCAVFADFGLEFAVLFLYAKVYDWIIIAWEIQPVESPELASARVVRLRGFDLTLKRAETRPDTAFVADSNVVSVCQSLDAVVLGVTLGNLPCSSLN